MTSLLLVVVLVTLSAYLRLAHSGIGCADWPACYGQIGTPVETGEPLSAEDAYRKLVNESGKSLAWATPLHRGVASVLGLLVLALFATAMARKRQRLVSLALLALTVYLAVLGIRSGGLHDPAVVMGNLAGGFGMLGLLGWLVFSSGPRGQAPHVIGILAAITCACLSLQIALGGLTSANFAALSCNTLPDCHGAWWPGPGLARAVDLSRIHEVTSQGQAVGGEERVAIHRAHRLGAIATWVLAAATALLAYPANRQFRSTAAVILLLATAEVVVGVASVATDLPIGLALAHNALAGLLLLSLLKLAALSLPSRVGASP